MTVNVTLTFPETVLQRIDKERGEIKRSTYVVKLLRQTHEGKVSKTKNTTDGPNDNGRQNGIRKANLKEPLQTASKVGPEGQSAKVETKTTRRGRE